MKLMIVIGLTAIVIATGPAQTRKPPPRFITSRQVTEEQRRAFQAAVTRAEELKHDGDLAMRRKDYATAEEDYRLSLSLGRNPEVRLRLADAIEKQGVSEEALAGYRSALKPHSSSMSEDPGLLIHYGELALSLGHRDEAAAAFGRAIHTASRHRDSLPRLQVRSQSMQALQAGAHAANGLFLMYRRGKKAAAPEFDKAVQLDPSWDAARFYRAYVYHSLGQKSIVDNDLAKLSHSSDPSVRNAVNRLGH